jgi:glycolate oxidase FAD binding subunit
MTATAAPRAVAPADAAEAAGELAACARAGEAVVFAGGSTLQSIGNAPLRCDVAFQTSGLRGIAAYDHRDMTAGIHAGTTMAEIARLLGEFNQWIPFDAPEPARATIGGTLAAGWAGPRRAAYGRPRDLVIGSTLALTDGTLAHAGGMVVKNVTGYDMSKLYVGSLGTLGLIVRANVKALPRPAAFRLAIAPVPDDVRDRTIAATGALAIEPTAVLMVDGFPGAARQLHGDLRLVMMFEGSEAVVDRATRDVRSALGKAGVPETQLIDGAAAERAFAEIVDAYIDVSEDRSITYRATGLPSSAWARTRTAESLAHAYGLDAESIADMRTGDALLRFSGRAAGKIAPMLPEFDAVLRRAIERTSVLAGAPALRALVNAWSTEPSTIDTMRKIKAQFDPANVLAPGRYVGAI